MDPLGIQVMHWGSAPLWCHVTDTSHGSVIEATFVLFDEALNFISLYPSNKWFNYWPGELLNPLESSKGWDCSISVSGKEKHSDVGLVLHDPVDPERSLVLQVPVRVHLIVALHPFSVLVEVEVWVDV